MTTSTNAERLGAHAARAGAAPAGRDMMTWVLLVLGIGNVANALWMLATPAGWYSGLPAAVPDFGPLNEHFVRDIGAAFLTLGLSLIWAGFVPRWRVPLVAPVTLFFALHALAHFFDTERGLVGAEHWAIYLPGVYVPALIMAALLWIVSRARPQPY